MKKRVTFGLIALSASVVGFAALQQTWKGMLAAQPAYAKLSSEAQSIGLTEFDSCYVLIEEMPDELKDSLTGDDVETWTLNRLKNTGIKAVRHSEVRRDFDYLRSPTDESMLRGEDRGRSSVYVNVGAVRTSSGTLFYTIEVEVRRAGFIHPGHFMFVTVWDRGSYGYFGSAHEAKVKLRESLNGLLDDLETDWKACNR